MNTFITKAKSFFLAYKWLLIPLIPSILFIYFIIFFIASNQAQTPLSNQHSTVKVSQSPAQNEVSPQTQISVSPSQQAEISPPYGLNNEVQGIAFGKMESLTGGNTEGNSGQGYPSNDLNDEFAEGSIGEQTLPDGSIQYEYQSDDPQRPHMQLVKNGIVLFRRTLMPSDTTLSYYSEYLTNPPYTSQGSSYFGLSDVILANPPSGVAVVYNPQSGQVYEQYLFPAISVDDYLKKFGSDISAFTPAP